MLNGLKMDNTEKYKYTEKFLSFQGEGNHTGKNTLWLRLFQCNLNCNGFGQTDPTNPASYVLPYETIDIKDITDLTHLPVFDRGCDSSYSWSKKFEHLAFNEDASTIAANLSKLLISPTNKNGTFVNPASGQSTHMCFTAGEQLMRPNQRAIEAVMREFHSQQNMPSFVTVETNGTQKLSRDFISFLSWFRETNEKSLIDSEWFWSVSPKLFNTSGEINSTAIKPDVVASYAEHSKKGQLKFVVNGSKETWKELELNLKDFRSAGVDFPVWIMPVGATKEQQEGEHIKEIVMESLSRGYHVSGRLHAYMLGNGMNT